MRAPLRITIFLWICFILFSACKSKNITNEAGDLDSNAISSTNAVPEKIDSNEVSNAVDSDCVRGVAEPILKKSIFPNSTFKLNTDHLTAIETTDLKSGDRLIIENDGCEYYVLAFRFETSRFQGDTTNVLFWLDKGHTLLTEVEEGINSSHVTDGIRGIKTFLETKKNITLQEEINFNDSEIRFFGLVRRIQKITSSRYGVEIVFAVGPL